MKSTIVTGFKGSSKIYQVKTDRYCDIQILVIDFEIAVVIVMKNYFNSVFIYLFIYLSMYLRSDLKTPSVNYKTDTNTKIHKNNMTVNARIT